MGGRQRGVLAAATLALAMMTIDVSIIRVALPEIQNELELSDATQQWIVNAYLLTMGTLAIAGGRAGDRFGRRWVFLVGVVTFISCSVLGGVSDSGSMLVAARGGQGVGAAIMTPGTTAMVTDAFSGPSLGRAMGILVGIGSVGISIGSLVGGFLVDFAGWRAVFFINVPVSLVVIALVVRHVSEARAERAPSLDPAGLLTLLIGMTALTLALVQLPVWSTEATVALLGVAAVMLVAWLVVESRAREPLVDPRVLRGAMLGGYCVAGCVPFVLSGMAVFMAIYLQVVLDYSALETGVLILPLTIPTLAGSLLSGRLANRIGPRAVVSGGMLIAAIGTYATGLGAGTSIDYLPLLPGLVLFAFGSGVALPSMTATIMTSAGAEERGMVSGVYNTSRLLGATVGLAAMGAVLATLEHDHLAAEQARGELRKVERAHIHRLLAGGESAETLEALGPKAVAKTEAGVKQVFDAAFSTTLKLASLIAALGAVVAFFAVPRLRAPPAARPELNQSAVAEA
jgi:EmrB/QacA subfamily drug resistance transporter